MNTSPQWGEIHWNTPPVWGQQFDPSPRFSTIHSKDLGDSFEDYIEIQRLSVISRGGQGDVHKAFDRRNQEWVAVKSLRPAETHSEDRRRRAERELRALSEDLSHPNLVTIVAHGRTRSGDLCWAMPLAAGSLEDDRLSFKDDPARICDVLLEVCGAISYLHEKKFIHRDIKPGNILKYPDSDGKTRWVVTDLGLARAEDRDTTVLTKTGDRLGTFGFMAPEQRGGDSRGAGVPADIYSLGRVALALLTGRDPIDDPTPRGHLAYVIRKATKINPGDRFASVAEFSDQLLQVRNAITGDVLLPPSGNIAVWLKEAPELLSVDQANGAIDWLQSQPDMESVWVLFSTASRGSLEVLRAVDGRVFRASVEACMSHIIDNIAPFMKFSDADPAAEAMERIDIASNDPEISGIIIVSLLKLGSSLNRYPVRDIFQRALKRAAARGMSDDIIGELLRVDNEALKWSIHGMQPFGGHAELVAALRGIVDRA